MAELLPRMRSRGIDVEVLALRHWAEDLGPELATAGVPVHRFELGSEKHLILGLSKLRTLLSRNDYAGFWSHLPWDHVYARAARALQPHSITVNTFHSEGYSQNPPRTLGGIFEVKMQQLACRGSARHVAVSEAVREDYAKFFGIPDIVTIYNGIDVDRIQVLASRTESKTVRAEHGVDEEAFLIVVPSRYVAKKGHAYLIRALQILRERGEPLPVVLMQGVGGLAKALGEVVKAARLDDIVRIGPVLPHERLFPLLKAANLVVQPSLREPFGIAALEALSLGTPVLLSDVDGFRETTANGRFATLVPPGDAEALADALTRIRANEVGERARAAAGAQHVRDNFNLDHCADRWAALFRDVMSESGKR